MKKIIVFIFLVTGLCITSNAQSDLKARIEFEEGEKAFNESRYDEAVNRLSKAQDFLGVWSAKISYLKILSLDKLADYQKFENSHTQLLNKEVKLYMDFVSKNQETIIEDKFKAVYRIDEKINYAYKLSQNEKMPEYLNGIEAYDKKDYAAALKLWEQAAVKGNLLAMDKISDMYRDEIGVKRDYEKSIEWDTKAAAQGHYPSIADIGTMYYQGWGVTIDYQKAVEKLTLGAENGLDYAMYYLGNLYCDKKSTIQDTAKGVEWLTKAATLGYVPAMVKLGWINYDNKNYKKAMDWFKMASDKGSSEALVDVGHLYTRGQGVTVDNLEAMKWFQMAIDKGYPLGMFRAAYLYQKGLGVNKDIHKAISLYVMAAEKGYGSSKEWIPVSNSMEVLAEIYRTGDGVKKDKKLADEWQAKCDAVRRKK